MRSATAIVIGLLGPVAVARSGVSTASGEVVPADLTPIAGVRARRLLVSLALASGRVCTSERLIADVWGDTPPGSPGAALHTQISRLRSVVGHTAVEGIAGGYRLAGCRTDLNIVAELASSGDPDDLVAATAWWRGSPGDDLGESVVDDVAEELRTKAGSLRADIDRRLMTALLSRADFAGARSVAEKLCAADELDESAHLALMRSLAGDGRIPDALAVFARLRRALSRELGIDPGPEALALNAELLTAARSPTDQEPTPSARDWRSRAVGVVSDSSDLIGRDDDIATIVALFGRHRLVTVQGPGGVGKTRVSHRVGAELARAGRSVFYVPLAPIRDDDDVVSAIAATLGVGESEFAASGRPRRSIGDLADRIIDAVRGLDVLLILDNCEQVVGRCATLVADLLAAEPNLWVLTTSRSPLMLTAETIYQLPTLGGGVDGASSELFERRARAIRPAATLLPAAVADLCEKLDGLPLAIELAAARIRTMSVAEITARLEERFALLRGTDRSAPDRHRTLYAVIEWSWDLLDDDARAALCALCRFPAGFTADAASVMLGYNGFRLDETLEALVNQSLLNVIEDRGHIRYRMLEMVREFGEAELATDPDASRRVDTAICLWAGLFAEAAISEYEEDFASVALVEAVYAESENLVWVLRRCVAIIRDDRSEEATTTVVTVFPVLAAAWVVRGLHAEVLAWSERIVPILPGPPADLPDHLRRCWQATVLAATLHQWMHRNIRLIAIGRMLLRRLHSPGLRLIEPTDFLSALLLSRSGTAASRLIAVGVRRGSPKVAMLARGLRMNVRENAGSLDPALSDGLAMIEESTHHDDVWLRAMPRMSVAGIYGQRGQWDRAVDYYRAVIADLDRLSAHEDASGSRCYLACALVALGRLDEAERELAPLADGWSVEAPDPQGHPEVTAAMMVTWAEIRHARGDQNRAAEAFGRAAALICREHPYVAADPGAVLLAGNAVAGMIDCGRVEQAREFLGVLYSGLRAMLGGDGWLDLPQGATIALTIGWLLCAGPDGAASDGTRLIALGLRLGVRRDLPSVHRGTTQAQAISGLTETAWAVVCGDAARLSKRQAKEAILDLIRDR
ncbi:MAG: winged helix-turn-helix domain-containing protein [Gordonia sp.]|nr:winged helix-turn-helix domain-containing protein [Gordonia sp. (in: high G+C Gram-positive bacteria)]